MKPQAKIPGLQGHRESEDGGLLSNNVSHHPLTGGRLDISSDMSRTQLLHMASAQPLCFSPRGCKAVSSDLHLKTGTPSLSPRPRPSWTVSCGDKNTDL